MLTSFQHGAIGHPFTCCQRMFSYGKTYAIYEQIYIELTTYSNLSLPNRLLEQPVHYLIRVE